MTAIADPGRPSGIPTRYRQARFRSRLEARWARFFDLIGWRWTYEPLDADGYIPDFLIHGDRPLFVEVGPCILEADFEAKAAKPLAAAHELGRDLLIVGVTPLADLHTNHAYGVAGGLLGEYTEDGWVAPDDAPALTLENNGYAFSTGSWFVCTTCRNYGVVHDDMDWTVRPCGHYDSGHNLAPIDAYQFDGLWNHAGSTVQWKPWR